MASEKRIYPFNLLINGHILNSVVIDSHYELNHKDMTDFLILQIVKSIDGLVTRPERVNPPFEYYKYDFLKFDRKLYRLVWCIHLEKQYFGVINCFRRK